MAKILVTGGAGYIGSHAAAMLSHSGHEVIVIDNFLTGKIEAIPKTAMIINLDICRRDELTEILTTERPEAIFHFAGKISVPESIEKPVEYFETNTAGTISLLHAANIANVRKIVFSSTAAVYGDVTSSVVSEDANLAPINPYGMSKAFAERIIEANSASTGMQHCILRYFNVAGAAMDGTNGQRAEGISQLIHVASEAALGRRPELVVYGNDYDTPDGSCIRDFIHVEDLVSAHLAALDYMESTGESNIFNVGYGHGYSVFDVINTIQQEIGHNLSVRVAGRRPGDPVKVIADNRRILAATKWRPKYDNIHAICRSALNWLSKSM